MRRLALVLAMSAAGCGPARAAPNATAVENGLRSPIAVAGEPIVTAPIGERMTHFKVPGLAIAVIDHGRIAWVKGYGNLEQGGPAVTAQTCFQVGSVSKAVTAVGAMKMVERRRLALDADANQALRIWKVPSKDRRTITLAQLLSHSGGIGVHAFWPGYEPGKPRPSALQILKGAPPATNPPITIETPADVFDYSGGGYQIVQQMMTDAAGTPFPRLMQSILFAPLAMRRSNFDQSPPRAYLQQCAAAHDREGKRLAFKYYLHPEMAAAGLWSTSGDLARLLVSVASAWNGRTGAILKPATARTMLTRRAGNWGLGFELEGEGKAFRFGHSGDNPGYKATMVMFPAVGQGAVVLTNGDRGEPLAKEVLLSVSAAYGWPAIRPTVKVKAPVDARELASVAGTYEMTSLTGVKLVITPAADGLSLRLVQATGESVVPFLPAGNRRYFRRDLDVELRFSSGSPAKSVDFIQDGSVFAAVRVPG